MVWIPLKNGSGQVLRDIRVHDPVNNKVYTVVGNKRIGINRYQITLCDSNNCLREVMNHELRNKWYIVGDWHSPERIANMYGKKIDPDANLPRPMRETFWKMKSRPGSHNYKQKLKLQKDPRFAKFSKYFIT